MPESADSVNGKSVGRQWLAARQEKKVLDPAICAA
jgi:hypothetical protein